MTQSERGIFETGNEVLQQVLQPATSQMHPNSGEIASVEMSLLIIQHSRFCFVFYVFIDPCVIVVGMGSGNLAGWLISVLIRTTISWQNARCHRLAAPRVPKRAQSTQGMSSGPISIRYKVKKITGFRFDKWSPFLGCEC
jgi:hypothetical protein